MSDVVLVTGAFGLVGSATVRQLTNDGRRLVATGRDTAVNRKAASAFPTNVEVRWADLTEPGEAERLVFETSPTAIVHLAAVIPPQTYRDADAARRVNVDVTAALVHAAEKSSHPPRFVQASSTAVYGTRNPHRVKYLLRADTPTAPFDLYGAHKLDAEAQVRSSALEWAILRLGVVISVNPADTPFHWDRLYFGSALPTDGRIHTVDVRDAATALAAATTADVAGEVLLIAGDESHMLRQADVASAMAAASGAPGLVPIGRPGNPDSDDWCTTDWMDTTHAQRALTFQYRTWPQMVSEMRGHYGWKRLPTRFVTPFARPLMKRHAAYQDVGPGRYADPWEAIRTRFGDPYARRPQI